MPHGFKRTPMTRKTPPAVVIMLRKNAIGGGRFVVFMVFSAAC